MLNPIYAAQLQAGRRAVLSFPYRSIIRAAVATLQKNFDAIFCKVAFGFRIYRENMNITDLPEGPYTIACYNRRNRIVLNGSCAHASAAVQARVTAPNKT